MAKLHALHALLLACCLLLSLPVSARRDLSKRGETMRGAAELADLSNAERFTRGLPPRRPSRTYNDDHRMRPRQSLTGTAAIGVYDSTNTFQCYITPSSTCVTALSSAQTFTASYVQSLEGLSPTTILFGTMYWALQALSDGELICADQPNDLQFGSTSQLQPAGTTDASQGFETTIWNVASGSLQITATWTNPPGDCATASPGFYLNPARVLRGVAQPRTLVATASNTNTAIGPAEAVTFKFVLS